MKLIVNIFRFITGILFVFSGMVKANDPRGLAYKMQEFFDVWGRDSWLHDVMLQLSTIALPLSLILITLEVIVGIALLLGSYKRLINWLLLILILFFTFLTGYAVLSGKIATCGCFGDCLPLTPMQSFIKDVVLLVFILVIVGGRRYVIPVLTPAFRFLILLAGTVAVIFFQWYVLRYNPVVDCLPFKQGNDILELRKMPADAVPDKKEYVFVYKKDGEQREFSVSNLPDSSWEFVSREDVIIEKGKNNEPPIKDFYLNSMSGTDSTEAILTMDTDYYLFFIRDMDDNKERWLSQFSRVYKYASQKGIPVYIVTPQPDKANAFFNQQNNYKVAVFSLDATSWKTAARTDPSLYLLHGPVIKDKWGWASLENAAR